MAGSRQSLPPESFGSILRRQRHTDGLTQARLSERLGVRQQTIGAWERGERPQTRFFNALANYLGLGEQDFLFLLDGQSEEALLADEEETLGIALVGDQLRMISIQADGTVRFIDPHYQSHTLLYIASLEAYELKSLVDELEALINAPRVSESQLQSFFERNPRFLCGDIYESAYPHIVLGRPDEGPLIPDFALKPSNESALCDLLEVKLPNAKLVVGRRSRKRLSAAVMEACAQLREYRDYFELRRNREAIEEAYGLRFFRPRMIVLIGKRSEYLAHDLRKAEYDLPYLTITTYDDLVERARSRMRTTKTKWH